MEISHLFIFLPIFVLLIFQRFKTYRLYFVILLLTRPGSIQAFIAIDFTEYLFILHMSIILGSVDVKSAASLKFSWLCSVVRSLVRFLGPYQLNLAFNNSSIIESNSLISKLAISISDNSFLCTVFWNAAFAIPTQMIGLFGSSSLVCPYQSSLSKKLFEFSKQVCLK